MIKIKKGNKNLIIPWDTNERLRDFSVFPNIKYPEALSNKEASWVKNNRR